VEGNDTALMGRTHGAKRGSAHVARDVGADRLAPSGKGREGRARACRRGLGRLGRKAEGEGVWTTFMFFFYYEVLVPFVFVFSIEFKSNQDTNSNLNISNMCINQKQSLSSA
jgi:hypothetical protein